MTIWIPDDLKNAIDDHPEITWSAVTRQTMWEYVRKIEAQDEIASKSELTEVDANELSKNVKHDIAKRYEN